MKFKKIYSYKYSPKLKISLIFNTLYFKLNINPKAKLKFYFIILKNAIKKLNILLKSKESLVNI